MNLDVDVESDRHLGHLVFECLHRYTDRICQIDAATGGEETYSSVLKRSIRLAKAFRAFGLNPGDVVAIGGLNHLDICIPFFAALFNGLPIVGVDPNFKYDEVRTLFEVTAPKVAFCQNVLSYDFYAKAAADLGLNVKLVTFDGGDCTMTNFVETYDTAEPETYFKVADYDVANINPFLIATSGSGGKVKVAAFKNKPLLFKQNILSKLSQNQQKDRVHTTLVLSPVNWISSYFATLMAATEGDIRLQTSKSNNLDHVIDLINKYRPNVTLVSPTLVTSLIARKNEVDLSSFHNITISGSKVYAEVFTEFKKLLSGKCIVLEAYGQTEMIGPVLVPNPFGPVGNCGKSSNMYITKLVHPDTYEEINEANVTGELLVKGPGFSGYYNDSSETARVTTADGFFKTGDLLFRDNDFNYYFVDRIKSLIKYRNSHVVPAELEEIINRHPGVKEVCVVGIDDRVDGQRPAACVVRQEGSDVTAQEIKDLIAKNLSENKQLRGGVVFVDSLPYLSTGKLARVKIRELALNGERE